MDSKSENAFDLGLDDQDKLEWLKQVMLDQEWLRGSSTIAITSLVDLGRLETYSINTVLCEQGQILQKFVLVLSGECELWYSKKPPPLLQQIETATLREKKRSKCSRVVVKEGFCLSPNPFLLDSVAPSHSKSVHKKTGHSKRLKHSSIIAMNEAEDCRGFPKQMLLRSNSLYSVDDSQETNESRIGQLSHWNFTSPLVTHATHATHEPLNLSRKATFLPGIPSSPTSPKNRTIQEQNNTAMHRQMSFSTASRVNTPQDRRVTFWAPECHKDSKILNQDLLREKLITDSRQSTPMKQDSHNAGIRMSVVSHGHVAIGPHCFLHAPFSLVSRSARLLCLVIDGHALLRPRIPSVCWNALHDNLLVMTEYLKQQYRYKSASMDRMGENDKATTNESNNGLHMASISESRGPFHSDKSYYLSDKGKGISLECEQDRHEKIKEMQQHPLHQLRVKLKQVTLENDHTQDGQTSQMSVLERDIVPNSSSKVMNLFPVPHQMDVSQVSLRIKRYHLPLQSYIGNMSTKEKGKMERLTHSEKTFGQNNRRRKRSNEDRNDQNHDQDEEQKEEADECEDECKLKLPSTQKRTEDGTLRFFSTTSLWLSDKIITENEEWFIKPRRRRRLFFSVTRSPSDLAKSVHILPKIKTKPHKPPITHCNASDSGSDGDSLASLLMNSSTLTDSETIRENKTIESREPDAFTSMELETKVEWTTPKETQENEANDTIPDSVQESDDIVSGESLMYRKIYWRKMKSHPIKNKEQIEKINMDSGEEADISEHSDKEKDEWTSNRIDGVNLLHPIHSLQEMQKNGEKCSCEEARPSTLNFEIRVGSLDLSNESFTKEQHRAALAIQKIFRGFLSRKWMDCLISESQCREKWSWEIGTECVFAPKKPKTRKTFSQTKTKKDKQLLDAIPQDPSRSPKSKDVVHMLQIVKHNDKPCPKSHPTREMKTMPKPKAIPTHQEITTDSSILDGHLSIVCPINLIHKSKLSPIQEKKESKKSSPIHNVDRKVNIAHKSRVKKAYHTDVGVEWRTTANQAIDPDWSEWETFQASRGSLNPGTPLP